MTEKLTNMSEKEQRIAEMEEYVSNLEKLIEEKKQAENLIHNPDFQKLILNNYCKRECIRYLQLALCDNITKEARDDSLAMAEDTAKLSLFLNNVLQFGTIAERDIKEAREVLAQLESEKED